MKKLTIEIKGVEFNNKGAELMLHSIIQMLDQQLGDYRLVLSPGNLLPFEKRAKVGAWQKFSFTLLGLDWTRLGNLAPAGLTRLMAHFGIVVEKDIDLVLDACGFVYSDKWGPKRLQQTLNQLKRMAAQGHRYIFLPQAFGPFENPKNSRLMAKIVKHADLVISRDDHSYQSLKRFDAMNRVKCFPDFTPLLNVSDVQLTLPSPLPERFVCVIPNNKMFGDKSAGSKEIYLQFLTDAILAVESLGLTPVLLNHEGAKDQKICQTVIDRLASKPLLLSGLDALQVKKIIGQSVFCLSSRFHGCISSLSQGVPALATSWSHKYEELYRYYQCDDYLLDVNSSIDELKDKMAEVLAQRETKSEQLLVLAKSHQSLSTKMWQEVLEVMGKIR